MKKDTNIFRTGFTLLELLVTVSIVAILAGLIMAASNKAIEMSRSTTCMSQMKTLYAGFQSYMQDNNGAFPPGQSPPPPDTPYPGWDGYWYAPTPKPNLGMAQYFTGGAEQLLRLAVCPKNVAQSVPAVTFDPYGYPYVCNYEIMPQNGVSKAPSRAFTIHASNVVLLTDSAFGADWKGPGVTAASFGQVVWSRIANRHLKFLNALWADGHVTTQTKESLQESDFVLQPR